MKELISCYEFIRELQFRTRNRRETLMWVALRRPEFFPVAAHPAVEHIIVDAVDVLVPMVELNYVPVLKQEGEVDSLIYYLLVRNASAKAIFGILEFSYADGGFMTEGQRAFSRKVANTYRLCQKQLLLLG